MFVTVPKVGVPTSVDGSAHRTMLKGFTRSALKSKWVRSLMAKLLPISNDSVFCQNPRTQLMCASWMSRNR